MEQNIEKTESGAQKKRSFGALDFILGLVVILFDFEVEPEEGNIKNFRNFGRKWGRNIKV